MRSRIARFEQWLKNKRCPNCGQTSMIPLNPRFDRRFRCCQCGATGRVKLKKAV